MIGVGAEDDEMARALATWLAIASLQCILAGCGGSAGGGATSPGGLPHGCTLTVAGDAASGVTGTTTTQCLGLGTADGSEFTQSASGLSFVIGLATFFMGAQVGTGGFGITAFDGALPVDVDITGATAIAEVTSSFGIATGVTIDGQWTSEVPGASATLHLTSSTVTDGRKCLTGGTCLLLHGTVHAVLLPDVAGGHPGKGTVTVDFTF